METLVHMEPEAVAWVQSYFSAVLVVSWMDLYTANDRRKDENVGTHDPRVKAEQLQKHW